MGEYFVFPQQSRAYALRSIWSINRAPQLSCRHPEPVRLCEEHSRQGNARFGRQVIAGSSSCHRLGFEAAFKRSPLFIDNSETCMKTLSVKCSGLAARSLKYRERRITRVVGIRERRERTVVSQNSTNQAGGKRKQLAVATEMSCHRIRSDEVRRR